MQGCVLTGTNGIALLPSSSGYFQNTVLSNSCLTPLYQVYVFSGHTMSSELTLAVSPLPLCSGDSCDNEKPTKDTSVRYFYGPKFPFVQEGSWASNLLVEEDNGHTSLIPFSIYPEVNPFSPHMSSCSHGSWGVLFLPLLSSKRELFFLFQWVFAWLFWDLHIYVQICLYKHIWLFKNKFTSHFLVYVYTVIFDFSK